MAEDAARTMQTDRRFFTDHPDRHFRIRSPLLGEFNSEFASLGAHNHDRRRIIVARVDKKRARHFGVPFARIPFLMFADESIEDTDAVLTPIFRRFLEDAAAADGRQVIL